MDALMLIVSFIPIIMLLYLVNRFPPRDVQSEMDEMKRHHEYRLAKYKRELKNGDK